MKILLVEDEDPKREAVLAFLRKEFSEAHVITAKSVRTAVSSIRADSPELLLLDMSLPTFDISSGEPGGRPQGFGGIEVMRFLETADVVLPTVVVTAYEAFAKGDGQRIEFEALRDELTQSFPHLFRGLVYFDTIQGEWVDALRSALSDVFAGGSQ